MSGARTRAYESRSSEIVQASAVLFEKVGYHGASMQMVAAAVGLGKPTLYHYFASKAAILYAIHEQLISELHSRHIARVERGVPPEAQLLGIHADILGQIAKHPGYVRAFFEHHDELDEVHKKELRRQRREYLEMVRDVIATGTKQGAFVKCDPRLTALGFLGMCNWAYKWFPYERNRSVEKTAESLCKVFLDGLRRR